MPVLAIAALAAAAVQLGTAIYGHLKAAGKQKEADEILKKAGGSFDNISLPDLEQITAETLGPTEFAKINMDPQLRQTQIDAMNKMQAIQQGGGFNDEDRANLNRMNNQVAQQAAGQRQLLSEQMAARGQGGSGTELAMQLANAQGAANRNMQAGLDTAAQAQKRYFDSVRAGSQMAGDVRNQDWTEASQKAAAQDAINKFNLGHRYEVQQYNNGLAQQGYDDQMGLARAKYGVAQDQANIMNGHAAQTQNFWGNVGAGAANTINAGVRMGAGQTSGLADPNAGVSSAVTNAGSDPYADWMKASNAGNSQYGDANVRYDPNSDTYSYYDGTP